MIIFDRFVVHLSVCCPGQFWVCLNSSRFYRDGPNLCPWKLNIFPIKRSMNTKTWALRWPIKFIDFFVTSVFVYDNTHRVDPCWPWHQIMGKGRFSDIEGILQKGPYLPCVSMVFRALKAGYPRYMYVTKIFYIVNSLLIKRKNIIL